MKITIFLLLLLLELILLLGLCQPVLSHPARRSLQIWPRADEFKNPHQSKPLRGVPARDSPSSTAMEKSQMGGWHSAAMSFGNGLTISHFPDPSFDTESANLMHTPAAGRYNNVSLISRSAFHPTPSSDVS
jgi:hypothetical protein